MTTTEIVLVKPAREELGRLTSGLDPESVAAIRAVFDGMFDKVESWSKRAALLNVTREDQVHEMKQARALRMEVKSDRVATDKARKRLKEDSLRRGQAIDAAFRLYESIAKPIEEHLLTIETFAERAAAARRDALRDARATALRALGDDPTRYTDLGAMTDDAWDATRDAAELAKKARDDEAARQEAIRVEAARIEDERRAKERAAQIKAEAERVEREKAIQAENAKLRAEAEKLEAEKQREIAKARADAEAREMAERAEREKAEAVARAEREKAAAAERELAAERERAAKEERDRKAEEERRAAAPDREKLVAFAAELRTMALPVMTTTRGQEITAKLAERLRAIANQIDDAAVGMGGAGEERAA